MPRDPHIELIEKLAAIIEALRNAPEGLSLQELANRTGYVKSSVYRVLLSLRRYGYVEQEAARGVYRLGVQFLLIAQSMVKPGSLVPVARTYLERLVADFDETAYLAVLAGGHGVFVDVEETRRDLRLVGPLGAEVHFHATAAGKAMAAYLPTGVQNELLKEIPPERITDRTLTTAAQIQEEWASVRRLGYAINDEETIPGAVFVAAPIFDSRGAVCASITIGIPKLRFTDEVRARLAPELVRSCREITIKLEAAGYVVQSGASLSPPVRTLQAGTVGERR